MDAEVQAIVKQYPVFEEGPFGKLHCKLTGHDVAPRASTLKEYLNTKRFKRAWEIHEILEAHPTVFEDLDEGLLGCKITKTVIARDPKALRLHLNGKKFKKALARGATGDSSDEEEEMEGAGMSDAELSGSDVDIGEDSDEEEETDEEEQVVIDTGKKKKTVKGAAATPKNVKKNNVVRGAGGDDYDFDVAMETESTPQQAPQNLKRKENGGGDSVPKKKKKK